MRPHPLVGALVLVAILSVLAIREEQLAVPRSPLLRLDGLSRRYADRNVTLEVIYASPLLPADEAANPVFRVVMVYRSSPPEGPPFPEDLGSHAQLRTSDGRVAENLYWQEEVHRADRVLGYLCYSPEERRPWLSRRTQWVELSLIGVVQRPLRFRWPISPPPAGGPSGDLVE